MIESESSASPSGSSSSGSSAAARPKRKRRKTAAGAATKRKSTTRTTASRRRAPARRRTTSARRRVSAGQAGLERLLNDLAKRANRAGAKIADLSEEGANAARRTLGRVNTTSRRTIARVRR